jgi:hypothetical protein
MLKIISAQTTNRLTKPNLIGVNKIFKYIDYLENIK